MQLGNYSPALTSLNKALELNRRDARVYKLRGQLYSKLKKYRLALAEFDKCLDINSEYFSVYAARANAYLNDRNPRGGLERLWYSFVKQSRGQNDKKIYGAGATIAPGD